MRVIVENVVAVNPHVIRISCYTCNTDSTDQDTETRDPGIKDYEIAVGIVEFTSPAENDNVNVDLQKLQQIISAKIVQSQNAANLARIVDDSDMSWDLILDPPVTDEQTNVDGMTLAYGETPAE